MLLTFHSLLAGAFRLLIFKSQLRTYMHFPAHYICCAKFNFVESPNSRKEILFPHSRLPIIDCIYVMSAARQVVQCQALATCYLKGSSHCCFNAVVVVGSVHIIQFKNFQQQCQRTSNWATNSILANTKKKQQQQLAAAVVPKAATYCTDSYNNWQ